MKPVIGLFVGMFLSFVQNETQHIYLPYFVQTTFLAGDSLRYAECFSFHKTVVHTDTLNNIHDVDSCTVYTVYEVKGSYRQRQLLATNRKRLIETYKRISPDSWLRTVGSQKTVVVEDPGNILITDSNYVEKVDYPGEYIHRIYHYYGFR